MAIALVVPAQVLKGQTIKVSGTGATASGNVNVQVSSEEWDGGVQISKAVIAADGAGAFDSTGKLDFQANEEGHVDITVTDATGGTTASGRVQVMSEG